MNFIQLRSYDNYVTANIQMAMLISEGIVCHLNDENTITIDPLLSPAIGGMKLMVHEAQAPRALELLARTDNDFLHHIPCPRCHSQSLEAVTAITKPSGILQKIGWLIEHGQAESIKTRFHCRACGADFDQIENSA